MVQISRNEVEKPGSIVINGRAVGNDQLRTIYVRRYHTTQHGEVVDVDFDFDFTLQGLQYKLIASF
jgi:hypothetical protein